MGRSLFLVGLPAAVDVVTAGLAFLGDLPAAVGVVTGVVTAVLVTTASCSSGVVSAELAFLDDLAPVTGVVTAVLVVTGRVLHGPGLGPRAGPARSPWAGPGQASMIFCGPGRVRA